MTTESQKKVLIAMIEPFIFSLLLFVIIHLLVIIKTGKQDRMSFISALVFSILNSRLVGKTEKYLNEVSEQREQFVQKYL